jgi:tetratricopeptide (TPR) repeat protein
MSATPPRAPLPSSYEGLHARAYNLAQSGDLEGAIALYRRLVERLLRLSDRILERRPELRDLHRRARLELTSLLHQMGRYAEALEVEEVLLETHPEEAEQWRRDLAVFRIAKGEVQEGLADLRSVAEEAPEEVGGWLILGTEARVEGQFADSREALDRALALCQSQDCEELASIHYQRFLLHRDMRQVDEALAAWEEALRHDPEIVQSIREVYVMLTEAGRYSEALRYISRDPNDLQAGYQRGLIARLTGNLVQAREEWRQVASLDPNQDEYGHDAWVESVLRLGDPEPALEWLQESLPRHGTPRLLVLSGIGWAMRGDSDLAARLFQQAINILRRQRPPKKKLEGADWRLLDSLVADEEAKKALKSYFAVVETIWGR